MCEGDVFRHRRPVMRPAVHQPRRIVKAFKGKALKPGAFQRMLEDKERVRAQLAVEADKTRYWLLDQGEWQNGEDIGTARIVNEKDGSPKDVTVYPIYDNPKFKKGKVTAEFFLGFDANVYYISDRFVRFDAEDPRAHTDTLLIIKRLRCIRGE